MSAFDLADGEPTPDPLAVTKSEPLCPDCLLHHAGECF
ncbi:hypothetical protein PROPHIGD79-1_76 [Mycobacterium phage prophi79-1]|nr:hypothetical protein PROPHIGD79-1_76 [Mycobacterium phage prophi79-1]